MCMEEKEIPGNDIKIQYRESLTKTKHNGNKRNDNDFLQRQQDVEEIVQKDNCRKSGAEAHGQTTEKQFASLE